MTRRKSTFNTKGRKPSKTDIDSFVDAAMNDDLDMVKLLFARYGQNIINRQDGIKDTALNKACWNGKPEMAAFLLENGADFEIRDDKGFTALIWAARRGHAFIVNLLLKKGADITATNNQGDTALVSAHARNHTRIEKMLLNAEEELHQREAEDLADFHRGVSNSVAVPQRLVLTAPTLKVRR